MELNRQVNICDVADEILVHIFTFLPSADVVSVSATCERFQKVCCEKRIVRCLDFSKCYHIHSTDLYRFLQPKLRRLNITVLNLNFCYWLKSNIFNTIAQLKNLKELHILECKVGLPALTDIVSRLQLQALSWTWESDTVFNALESILGSLSLLTQLHVQLTNVFQLSQLIMLLQYCSNLEELTVSKRSRCSQLTYLANAALQHHTAAPPKVTLYKLRRLYILLDGNQGVDVTRFAQELLTCSCRPKAEWETVWTSENGCNVLANLTVLKKMSLKSLANATSLNLSGSKNLQFQIIRNDSSRLQIAFINKLLTSPTALRWRHLSLDLLKVPADLLGKLGSSCKELQYLSMQDCALQGQPEEVIAGLSAFTSAPNLTYLNLSRTHLHSQELNPCLALSKLTALEKLAIPACFLATNSPTQSETSSNQDHIIVFKPKRVGLNTNIDISQSNSRLLPLTEGCPNLKRLVVSGITGSALVGERSACLELCKKVNDADFSCVSRWKKLETFSLSYLPGIRHGKFLESLTLECPGLTGLTLVSLGPSGKCSYNASLNQCLKSCKELRDLRILQNDLDMSSPFGFDIRECQKLERLSFSAQNSSLHIPHMFSVVEMLPALIMVYVVSDSSNSMCQRLERSLNKRFVRTRPAFTAHVISRQTAQDSLEGMPTFHLEEMTFNQPTTVIVPE